MPLMNTGNGGVLERYTVKISTALDKDCVEPGIEYGRLKYRNQYLRGGRSQA